MAVQKGPDEGWSWVIAFAACFDSLVLAGIFRTSGVFFVAFISEFGVTREEAAWPVALCISVLNLTGIITGPLGQRFGVRPVSLVGSLIAAIGVSSCYFATSLGAITFCFGVVFGVGFGLVSTLMPVIVNEYFLNHRATANGIANSGSCFGSIILPPLFEFFLDSYGLSGCFLLTGGIVLQITISSALMRPPLWLQKSNRITQSTSKTNFSKMKSTDIIINDKTVSGYNDVIKSIRNRNVQLKRSNDKENTIESTSLDVNLEKLKHKSSYTSSEIEKDQNFQSKVVTEQNDERNIKEMSKNGVTTENFEIIDTNKGTPETDLNRSLRDLEEFLDNFPEVLVSPQNSTKRKSFDNSVRDNSVKKSDSKNFNQEVNYANCSLGISKNFAVSENEKIQNDVQNVNEHESRNIHSTNNHQHYCSNTDITAPNSLRKESFNESNISSSVFTEDTDNRNREIEQTDRNVRSISIVLESFKKVLTCPMFYVTAITNVSFYFLYHMYVVIIVDFSLDREVLDKDTKYVLFAFATSDLLGRLCFGWVTDRKLLRRSQFVMCCMSFIGVTFFCFPLVSSYTGLIVVSSLYGLLLGCTMVVFPILLVDFLGIEIHAIAMGCMCFMNGLSSLLRPFIIGFFRDYTGSYSNIFNMLGVISLVASFLWLLECCFVKTVKTKEGASTV